MGLPEGVAGRPAPAMAPVPGSRAAARRRPAPQGMPIGTGWSVGHLHHKAPAGGAPDPRLAAVTDGDAPGRSGVAPGPGFGR